MPAPTDQKLERLVGGILRIGVSTAAAVTLAGAILYLGRHGAEVPRDLAFPGEASRLRGFAAIAQGVSSLSGRGIIQLGLALLVATPVARVALSIVAFAAQGDRKFVAITVVVLAVLVYGLFGSPL